MLLQSHWAGLASCAEAQAVGYLRPDEVFFLYPFRRFSATMRSFAAYCRYPGRVVSFLDEPSKFLPHGADGGGVRP